MSSHSCGATHLRMMESVDEAHPSLTSIGASDATSWPIIADSYNDTALEQDDEECVNIERRSSSLLKTPEQPHAIVAQSNSAWSLATSSGSIQNPPLLRPKHPSLTHSHQPWNVPTDQEYEELSSRLSVDDAPLFPQSPALSSPSRRRTHVSNNTFWNRSTITASNASSSSTFGHDASVNTPTRQDQHLHKRSTSLQRRVLLSFKDCHFVRLPPRVSRSDGYLHDITWRVQQMDTGASSIEDNTFVTSPDRKRNKVNPSTIYNEMPMLTPIEGYTIASARTATIFTNDDASATPQTENHRKRSDDRLTFYRDKFNYSNVDEVVYAKSLNKTSSQQNDLSREATPLPLLDFDDDSASMSSWNDGSSYEGRCNRYSESPNSDTTTTNNESAITIAAVPSTTSPEAIGDISTTTTATSASLLQRTIPMKPPKLKMRTNHPLLTQHSNFASFVLSSPKHQPE